MRHLVISGPMNSYRTTAIFALANHLLWSREGEDKGNVVIITQEYDLRGMTRMMFHSSSRQNTDRCSMISASTTNPYHEDIAKGLEALEEKGIKIFALLIDSVSLGMAQSGLSREEWLDKAIGGTPIELLVTGESTAINAPVNEKAQGPYGLDDKVVLQRARDSYRAHEADCASCEGSLPDKPNLARMCPVGVILYDSATKALRKVASSAELVKGTFAWAMKQINDGKEIRRQSDSKHCYGLDDGNIYVRQPRGDTPNAIFIGSDVTATDWEVV